MEEAKKNKFGEPGKDTTEYEDPIRKIIKQKTFDTTKEVGSLEQEIDKDEKWIRGEEGYRVGGRKLYEVSAILDAMHPQAIEKLVENAIQKVVNIANQLREAGITTNEEDFVRDTVNDGIVKESFSKELINLIDRWLEKNGDTNSEKNKKINLQKQFRQKFEPININDSPQPQIKLLEEYARAGMVYKIREELWRYKIPNTESGQSNRLDNLSINSITNALMAGLKVSEINELNSSRAFNFSDTKEKTELRKQLLQAAVDYNTIFNEEEKQITKLSEYAQLDEEEKTQLSIIVDNSDRSSATRLDNPGLQQIFDNLHKIYNDIESAEKEGYPAGGDLDTIKEQLENQAKKQRSQIREYIPNNIDDLADMYRNPKEARRIRNHPLTKIIGVYVDRLSKNMKNPPSEFVGEKRGKLDNLQKKLQGGLDKKTNLVFDARAEAIEAAGQKKKKKKEMETVVTSPYLKFLRRKRAVQELVHLENVQQMDEDKQQLFGPEKIATVSEKDKEKIKDTRNQLHELYSQEADYLKESQERGAIDPVADLIMTLRKAFKLDSLPYSFSLEKWNEITNKLKNRIEDEEADVRQVGSAMHKLLYEDDPDGELDDDGNIKQVLRKNNEVIRKGVLLWMRRYKKTPQWSPKDIEEEKHLEEYRDKHGDNRTGDSGQIAA